MNLYCIWHLTNHYRDADNYSGERDQSSNLSMARENEDKDTFISRLVEKNLPVNRILPCDYDDAYTTFHVDYLFYSDNVETDIDIEKLPIYLEKIRIAKEIKEKKKQEKQADELAIKRREYERLKKELEINP